MEEGTGNFLLALEIEVGILFAVFSVVACLHIVYFFLHRLGKPIVQYYPSPLNKYVAQQCPTFKEVYYPPLWLPTSHLHGILALFVRRRIKIAYKNEELVALDGGKLVLRWHPDSENLPESAPTLMIIPGATGGSDKTYVTHMVEEARKKQWRVVVLIFPGCEVENSNINLLKSPRFYSPVDVSDVQIASSHLRKKYPKSPLIAIGHSMGGCMLTKYLGQPNSLFTACVILSNPWCLKSTTTNWKSLFFGRWVYEPFFYNYWFKSFKENEQVFVDVRHPKIDHSLVHKSRSLDELTERLLVPLYGFESLSDYYEACTSKDSPKTISTPTLFIHALDDAVACATVSPTNDILNNPNCINCETISGGHTGWMEGLFLPTGLSFADRMCIEYFEALLKYSATPKDAPTEKEKDD